jgi:ABC-type transport system involved in multi-copper enzyme maturation permease subunit
MNSLWPIALITFKEGIRNRALYGISLLALLLLAANQLISSMIMRDVGKVAVDIALSSVSLSGLLIVFFVGINLLAKDLDRKTIYMVLSKPISRGQYLVGKYLGIALLIIATVIILALFSTLSIYLVKITYPTFFPRFSWAAVILAIAFTLLSLLVLAAVSCFYSTLSTSSFTTLVLTIVTYIIGHSLQEVKALVEAPGKVGIHVAPLTVKVVQVASYLFPNLTLFDLKAQAAHAMSIPTSYLVWVFLYGVIYILVTLAVATLCFSRRQFP